MLKVKGFKAINCGTAVSVPHDISEHHAVFEDIEAINCGKGFEVRDKPSFFESIGLKADTPPEVLIKVLNELKANQSNPEETIRKHGVLDWIGAAGNVASVVSTLVAISSNPALMTQVISLL